MSARLALTTIAGLLLGSGAVMAQVVPAPQHFSVDDHVRQVGHLVRCDGGRFLPQAQAFVSALQDLGVDEAALTDDGAAAIVFTSDSSLGSGAYRISVGEHLTVAASSPFGAAAGAASLLQLTDVDDGEGSWPGITIIDEPDFSYRSFMVDMGRNPHSPETLRGVVDMLWLYKANYLHLHLTDDQIISWPSRAFPKLSSARAGWTWQDFVDLESYASARGVAIVPEIDVPGHSTILRREYPEVFGKTPTELATLPEAQAGVEQLLAEFLTVFESAPFVHIGGDEAYGVSQEVQRDFLNRLNAFVKSEGRRTVVWEGPSLGAGDNKVAEDVIHINWRTIDFPAQEMLDAGYEVVSAPWDPMYIVDHYPRTMFTAVDVERCYEWDARRFAHINHGMPTFAKPHRTMTTEGILGFCMPWWEGREENLFALCVPRFAAVASAAWNRTGENDFAGFEERQKRALAIFERVAGIELPVTPYADPETQTDNFAYRARVTPSSGASQPHFGPERLTNGIPDKFDHFLGFPTQPEPLEIVLELVEPAELGRIVVFERAVGESHEIYDLLVSADGKSYEQVGEARKGSRGSKNNVEHAFPEREVAFIKILTQGCHGLTFPSFSRLTEVMAFRE